MNPIDQLIQLALTEDIGSGDVTADAIFGETSAQGEARIYAKQTLVISGLNVAAQVFQALDPNIQWKALVSDGELVDAGQTLVIVQGPAAALLKAERTALNFLQHLSGVATYTRQFVNQAQGTEVVIRDTRKTLPGYRVLEKAATRHGGAENHRMGLHDQFLIKDNHIDVAGSITTCVERARSYQNPAQPSLKVRGGGGSEAGALKIQVEVRNESELGEALAAGADSILLDNMNYQQVEAIVRNYGEKIELEVSGGVTLETVKRWAQTGVHAISIGALTHSAPAVDVAMELKTLT